MFWIGILPALLTLWIRRRVPEPEMWRKARTGVFGPRAAFADIFRRPIGRLTLMVTLMNACTMFGWWGFNLWLPGYLSLPVAEGGRGFPAATMSMFILAMQVGMWFGYVTFGYASDLVGRKRAYVGYTLTAALLIFAYISIRSPLALLLIGPLVAFFATGYFSGFGAVTAEVVIAESSCIEAPHNPQ